MSVGGEVKARIAFKRLERDDELIKRFHAAQSHRVLSYVSSKDLDDLVWDRARMQRRIVEDEA